MRDAGDKKDVKGVPVGKGRSVSGMVEVIRLDQEVGRTDNLEGGGRKLNLME